MLHFVADWLQKLGLGEYAQRFAESDITYAVLSHLTDQDFRELGIASLGHRRQLLLAIAELDKDEKDTALNKSETAERRQVTVMFSDLVSSTALSPKATIAAPEPTGAHEL